MVGIGNVAADDGVISVAVGIVTGEGSLEDEPLLDGDVILVTGGTHGSDAVVARLGDVRGRAHLEQPLAH